MNPIIQKYQKAIENICRKTGITYLAVFGSQARGTMKPDSDIDFLVEFKETPSLVNFIRVKQEFENILDKKVDLVTKKGLSQYIKPFIQKDLQKIFCT